MHTGKLIIIMGLLVACGNADLIKLKTGKTVQGIIVQQDDDFVNIKTDVGMMNLPRNVIESVDKESPAMNQMRSGDAYVSHGEWDKAKLQYEAALRIDPTLTDAKTKLTAVEKKLEEVAEEKMRPMLQEGDRLLEKGRYEAAAKFFSDSLETYSKGELGKAIRRRLAMTYYQWGKDRLDRASKYEAIDTLKKATQIDPTFADAYFLMGDISCTLSGREEDAIQYYSTGLRYRPSYWVAFQNRGSIYLQNGQIQPAIEDFQVVYQNPTGPLKANAADKLMQCYWSMGKQAADQKNWKAAINHYEKALQYDNDSTGLYLDQAKAYLQVEDYSKATSTLCRVIARDEKSGEAQQLLGDSYMTLHQYADAVAPYQRARQLMPNNFKIICGLTEAYKERGMYDDAISLCQQAVQMDAKNFEGYYLLGSLYSVKEQLPDALKNLQQAVSMNNTDVKSRLELGSVYKKMKQYDSAMNEFQEALRLNPQLAAAKNEIGLVNVMMGNYLTAVSDFEGAIAIDDKFIDSYINLGDVYRIKKMYDKADESYRKAIQLNPNNPKSYLGLAITAQDYHKDYGTALYNYKNYLKYGGKLNDQISQWMEEAKTLSDKTQ